MADEEKRSELATKLQLAVNAARDLARAAQAGAPVDTLDQLAGQVIQLTGAFRAALTLCVVHLHTSCEEMGYEGASCLETTGTSTTDKALVTCAKCRKVADLR